MDDNNQIQSGKGFKMPRSEDIKSNTVLKSAFFGWLILLTVLSLVPSSGISVEVSDKLLHYIAYFITTAWICLAFRQKKLFSIFLCSVFIFLYSIAIEIVQHFMPAREFSFKDIIANLSGILSFVFIYTVYLSSK